MLPRVVGAVPGFHAPACRRARYVAMRKAVEFSQKERFGSFDCWECKNEIYRWSDMLEHVEWDFVYSWG